MATPEPSVLRFVSGELQRQKVGWLYRFSLVVVAVAMVFLPLLYCTLVVLCAFAVYNYATHFYSILLWPLFGLVGIGVKIILYFVPLICGSILTLFLIKPLFAPRRTGEEHLPLNYADAPQLFALIGWICRSLDAPIPSRIDLDCGVNASAGFRGGLRSLFDNELVLTIGLPLVAGMNLSQFAVVIAHEYGHFSQGTAMRASYVINRINHWFYRVVYERDAWDDALEEAAMDPEQGIFTSIYVASANLGVGFGRGVLWVFLQAGGALSSFMSRQMEFNADAYAIRMAGSKSFLSATRRVRQLGLGSSVAFQQLKAKWKSERKLFDQIPLFIVSRANEIPADTQDQFYTSSFQQRTRLFDVHPSDADRLARALAAREPGIFHSEAPAASLFPGFAELCRRITLAHYHHFCGEQFSPDWLIPTDATLSQAEHDPAADASVVKGFLLGITVSPRPLVICEGKELQVRVGEPLIGLNRESRQRMRELHEAAMEAQATFQYADSQLLRAHQAAQLFRAGFSFEPSELGVSDLDPDQAIADALALRREALEKLKPFFQAGQLRLSSAVHLLVHPRIARHVPNAGRLQDDTRELIWVLARMEGSLALLPALQEDCAILEMLLRYRTEQPGHSTLNSLLLTLCENIQKTVDRIQSETCHIRYPFRHATEQVLVGEYARNKDYHPDPLEQVRREGQSHVDKIGALHQRILATLVLLAETVERQLPAS